MRRTAAARIGGAMARRAGGAAVARRRAHRDLRPDARGLHRNHRPAPRQPAPRAAPPLPGGGGPCLRPAGGRGARIHLARLVARPDIRLERLEGRGVARSRNSALAGVQSDIVLFADDDVRLLCENNAALREVQRPRSMAELRLRHDPRRGGSAAQALRAPHVGAAPLEHGEGRHARDRRAPHRARGRARGRLR